MQITPRTNDVVAGQLSPCPYVAVAVVVVGVASVTTALAVCVGVCRLEDMTMGGDDWRNATPDRETRKSKSPLYLYLSIYTYMNI